MSNEIKIKITSDYDAAGMERAKRDLLDIGKAADKAGKEIADLDRKVSGVGGSKKIRVQVEPDTDSAKNFLSKLADTAMTAGAPAMKLMGSHTGITVGAAAGVAAAPVLLSALGSALSAAAGAGVLGAGVAAAISGDEELQTAGKAMAKNVLGAFQDEAATLKGPIEDSFGVLEDAGERVARKWGDAFFELRGELVPFVEDAVQGAERISDAFTDVAKDSGKESLDALGDTWSLLADGVGDFVEIVADSGPKAADNLRLVAGATGDLLRQTAGLIDMTAGLANNPWITGPLIPDLRKHYADAADATGTFKQRTVGLTDAMIDARDAAEDERASLAELSAELKAQSDPVFGIIKAQNDLEKAQKETAKATKDHGRDSNEAQEALQKQALAALELEANIGELGDTFDGKLSPAMRATFKAAGLTDEAVDGLERQFREAKKAGDQFSDDYRAKVSLSGAPKVKADLYEMRRIANQLDGRVIDMAMRITGQNNVSAAAAALRKQYSAGGITGAADGGIRDGMSWTGENGPELLELPPGTRVHSNPDSMRIAAEAAGGAGGGGMITVNLVVDGRVLAQAMMDPQREIVQSQFGGSAQQAWGR